MAYADSAIDYNWEIVNLDLNNRTMTVQYTADSSRPAVFLNHSIGHDQFNESDLTAIATSNSSEVKVVSIWDRILEVQSYNPGFNADSYIGNTYSSRYKVRTQDSISDFNILTRKIEFYDSEGNDEIRRKYNITAMSDSEKADARSGLIAHRNSYWLGLQKSGYLGTATSALGVDTQSYDSYDNEDVNFLTAPYIQFGDSLSSAVQSAISLNDSDYADWMLNTAGTTELD